MPAVVDPDGDLVSLQLDTAPAGATIDPVTGVVTLTAPADGLYHFAIRADDGRSGVAVQDYVLSVGLVAANPGVAVFQSTPPTEALVDRLYLYLPVAEDSDGDALTFTLLDGPAGMQIDPPTGRIDWTPAADQLGPHAVLLVADDGRGGSASQSFTIEVAPVPPNRPPLVDSTPVLIATQGEPYSYAVTTTDPDGDTPITFALVTGPAAMLVHSDTGQLTWTPSPADVGRHTIELRAVDPSAAAGRQFFVLEVRGPNQPPELTSEPVTTVSAGGVYRYDVTATDTADAVEFSLVSAPTGMTISPRTGIVFWKTDPADLGDHAIEIRVADDRGLAADQSVHTIGHGRHRAATGGSPPATDADGPRRNGPDRRRGP